MLSGAFKRIHLHWAAVVAEESDFNLSVMQPATRSSCAGLVKSDWRNSHRHGPLLGRAGHGR
jgi:hypothetical protein